MRNRLKGKPSISALLCLALFTAGASAQDTSGQQQTSPGAGGQQPGTMQQQPGTTQPGTPSGTDTQTPTAAQPAAGAQNSTAQKPKEKPVTNVADGGDNLPDLIELNVFGGVSLFGQVNRGLNTKHLTGWTGGGRVGANLNDYWGLELGYNFMTNNVRFITPLRPNLPRYDFSNRIHQLSLNPVFHFTKRGSRVRPYVTAGASAVQFTPTDDAKRIARDPGFNAIYGTRNLNDNLQPALNYGGGVKFHFSDHLGFRLDARGLLSRNPTYGLPDYPTGGYYIPSNDKLNGIQLTAGLTYYLGRKAVPPPPPPPPPPAPISAGSITGGEGTLCQGKPVTLHSSASDSTGHQLAYAWKLNGQPQGSNSPDFQFTPNNGGDFQVEVAVSDSTNPQRTATAGPVAIKVNEYMEPQITTISGTPNALSCASDQNGQHTAQLAAQVNSNACNGNVTYKWTVSEGTVSNDSSQNATFDASSLNFDNAATEQSKTVTATLTVTDESGKTSSKTTEIAVKCPPKFVRFSDVVFPKNNTRINNCGKRVLIDEVGPKVASGDYDVVLVGHIDSDETATAPATRGRRRATKRQLDEARVLNAAAVLSGGSGTCGSVDPSRIKVDWVGTDQTSNPDPGLCGTSTRQEQKERKSSTVSDSDKNRRVEVYLVPRGSAMPPAVKNAKELPAADLKALGCPK